jgi:voltage-dependent potassium channel beta subunit
VTGVTPGLERGAEYNARMNYKRLGRSGLKVSELSFGSWITYGNQMDTKAARDCMAAAWEAGVNFFDNAEVYASGKSEEIMGEALRQLGWPRVKYVVSTKFFWGIVDGPNTKNTLNRKYLMDAIDGALKRLQMDYVDLVYCHRPDPDTPMEETVWAMHDMIERGKALYWGTSEWSAAAIESAFEVAEKYRLRKPVMEQPEYNLFHRKRVEVEYAPLYAKHGLGLTTWSPLSSGLLTGKYRNGVPKESRGAIPRMAFLVESLTDKARNEAVGKLEAVAKDLGCTVAQLAIAWCARNPHVSTVITGASRPEQVRENMKAVEVVAKLDDAAMKRIEAIARPLSDL